MIKLVVFDAYGTLFDVYSVVELAETFYPKKGLELATLWREKQIEYTRLITEAGSQHYLSFWDVTIASLRYACQKLSLQLEGNQEHQFLNQYLSLKAFDESLHVLKELKNNRIQTAILSNGSPEMLLSAVENAGMSDYLDKIISVDDVKLYKVAPEAYDLVLKNFDFDKKEVLFVSSNSWDALGATWYGFKTYWVNRYGLPFETIGPKPSKSGPELGEVIGIALS